MTFIKPIFPLELAARLMAMKGSPVTTPVVEVPQYMSVVPSSVAGANPSHGVRVPGPLRLYTPSFTGQALPHILSTDQSSEGAGATVLQAGGAHSKRGTQPGLSLMGSIDTGNTGANRGSVDLVYDSKNILNDNDTSFSHDEDVLDPHTVVFTHQGEKLFVTVTPGPGSLLSRLSLREPMPEKGCHHGSIPETEDGLDLRDIKSLSELKWHDLKPAEEQAMVDYFLYAYVQDASTHDNIMVDPLGRPDRFLMRSPTGAWFEVVVYEGPKTLELNVTQEVQFFKSISDHEWELPLDGDSKSVLRVARPQADMPLHASEVIYGNLHRLTPQTYTLNPWSDHTLFMKPVSQATSAQKSAYLICTEVVTATGRQLIALQTTVDIFYTDFEALLDQDLSYYEDPDAFLQQREIGQSESQTIEMTLSLSRVDDKRANFSMGQDDITSMAFTLGLRTGVSEMFQLGDSDDLQLDLSQLEIHRGGAVDTSARYHRDGKLIWVNGVVYSFNTVMLIDGEILADITAYTSNKNITKRSGWLPIVPPAVKPKVKKALLTGAGVKSRTINRHDLEGAWFEGASRVVSILSQGVRLLLPLKFEQGQLKPDFESVDVEVDGNIVSLRLAGMDDKFYGLFRLVDDNDFAYYLYLGQNNLIFNPVPQDINAAVPVSIANQIEQAQGLFAPGKTYSATSIESRSSFFKSNLFGSHADVLINAGPIQVTVPINSAYNKAELITGPVKINTSSGVLIGRIEKNTAEGDGFYRLVDDQGLSYAVQITVTNVFLYSTPLKSEEKIPAVVLRQWFNQARKDLHESLYYYGLATPERTGRKIKAKHHNPNLTVNPAELASNAQFWQDIIFPDGEILGAYFIGGVPTHIRYLGVGDDEFVYGDPLPVVPAAKERTFNLFYGQRGEGDGFGTNELNGAFGVHLVFNNGYFTTLPASHQLRVTDKKSKERFNSLLNNRMSEIKDWVSSHTVTHPDSLALSAQLALYIPPADSAGFIEDVAPLINSHQLLVVPRGDLQSALDHLGRAGQSVMAQTKDGNLKAQIWLTPANRSKDPFDLSPRHMVTVTRRDGDGIEKISECMVHLTNSSERIHGSYRIYSIQEIESGTNYYMLIGADAIILGGSNDAILRAFTK